MNDYSIALLLHVVGALGFFMALALEWTNLRQLRRATTASPTFYASRGIIPPTRQSHRFGSADPAVLTRPAHRAWSTAERTHPSALAWQARRGQHTISA